MGYRPQGGTVGSDREQRPAVTGPHGICRSHRQRARVVRFCGVRVSGERYRRAVLSEIEPGDAADLVVRGVRDRVHRAAGGQRGARARGGPDREARTADALDRVDGRVDARDRVLADVCASGGGRADLARGDAVDPGVLARRRVHGLDGVHDRARVPGASRIGVELDRGGDHAGVHSRIGDRVRDQAHIAGGRCPQLWLAHPVHCERDLLHHRLLLEAWHRRAGGVGKGEARARALDAITDPRLEADRGAVRNRVDDERGVLPHVHVRRRCAQGREAGWRHVHPGQHDRAVRGVVFEALRWLALGSDRPEEADDVARRRDAAGGVSGARADDDGNTAAVRGRAAVARDPARHGARAPGRDGHRNLSRAIARDLDEHRVLDHARARRWHRPAGLDRADRCDRVQAGARVLPDDLRRDRPRDHGAHERDQREVTGGMNRDALASLGTIQRLTPISGGDINAAYRCELADRTVFVKWQERALPGLFEAEAAGLRWLRGPVRTPEVIAVADHWIALEWLDLAGKPDPRRFGEQLAQLHALGAPSFGLAHPNYLATLAMDNTAEPDWPTFYVERRLRPLCRGVDRELDQLRSRPELFGPPEPPARLHGDLWWGNVGAVAGKPVIFDPAVFGGHREIDLAMLELFGGLPDALVAGYDSIAPLAAGWRDRIALYQLLPLAAHARLFGGGYDARVARSLATLLA